MTHASHVRLVAGAVLDDLTPQERADWLARRAACPECRALEAQLAGVVADLALLAPRRLPPASLLDGIRAAIHSEGDRA